MNNYLKKSMIKGAKIGGLVGLALGLFGVAGSGLQLQADEIDSLKFVYNSLMIFPVITTMIALQGACLGGLIYMTKRQYNNLIKTK